jgi:hypothetical protein
MLVYTLQASLWYRGFETSQVVDHKNKVKGGRTRGNRVSASQISQEKSFNTANDLLGVGESQPPAKSSELPTLGSSGEVRPAAPALQVMTFS